MAARGWRLDSVLTARDGTPIVDLAPIVDSLDNGLELAEALVFCALDGLYPLFVGVFAIGGVAAQETGRTRLAGTFIIRVFLGVVILIFVRVFLGGLFVGLWLFFLLLGVKLLLVGAALAGAVATGKEFRHVGGPADFFFSKIKSGRCLGIAEDVMSRGEKAAMGRMGQSW